MLGQVAAQRAHSELSHTGRSVPQTQHQTGGAPCCADGGVARGGHGERDHWVEDSQLWGRVFVGWQEGGQGRIKHVAVSGNGGGGSLND